MSLPKSGGLSFETFSNGQRIGQFRLSRSGRRRRGPGRRPRRSRRVATPQSDLRLSGVPRRTRKKQGHEIGASMNELKGWMARGDNALIVDYLPTDHSRQSDSLREATRVLQTFPPAQDVLIVDLGCRVGSSFDVFRWQHANVRWIGLDIERSPEVDTRTRTDVEFLTYDGVHIPLADQSVDIVYSRQVFEHVRHPQVLIEEVHRVLKQDGVFVGSTSHLEPFHSRSYWNYTPYGFCVLLREIGFRSILVRPGIDSLTLIRS